MKKLILILGGLLLTISLIIFFQSCQKEFLDYYLKTHGYSGSLNDTKDNNIIFEKSFTRGNGAPQTESFSFDVNNIGDTLFFEVINGPDKSEKVSSAKIWLNDIQIFSPLNFNNNIDTLVSPFKAKTTNLVKLQLNGKPGSTIKIIILEHTKILTKSIQGVVTVKFPIGVFNSYQNIELSLKNDTSKKNELENGQGAIFRIVKAASFQISVTCDSMPLTDSTEIEFTLPAEIKNLLNDTCYPRIFVSCKVSPRC